MLSNRRSSPLATALVCLLLLGACSTTQQSLRISQSPPSIAASAEITSVPFYPQQKYHCGPAALATVLNHYQPETDPQQLVPMVYVPVLKGSLQVEMLTAARSFGRLAVELDGQLQSLLQEIAAGNPVLVLQNLGFGFFPYWHYAVVVGYDLPRQEIILRSGREQRLVRPFSVFERTWKRAGYWSMLALPPTSMPATVGERPFTRAAVALESLDAYQSGASRWPHNYILQMGLGNSAFAAGEYAIAEQAFKAATRIQPERTEGWNNLAYALLKLGNREAAIDAIQQALKLAPNDQNLLHSQGEILSHP